MSFKFHLLDQVVVPPEGGTVALPDGDTDPQNDTRIEIPTGALHEDTVISITKVDAAPAADFAVVDPTDPRFNLCFAEPIAAYEIAARDDEGHEVELDFWGSATLYLAYPDADDDGNVDGISPVLPETLLDVRTWNPLLGVWEVVPDLFS